MRAMIDPELVRAHRERALSPAHPVVRGTAHNPDTFFQARESASVYHARAPAHVLAAMDRFFALTGRRYSLFRYAGHTEAERVVVAMGSGSEVVAEAAEHLAAGGERVGALPVLLYRPSPRSTSSRPCPRRQRSSWSSIAAKSQAGRASRSTRTRWPRSRRRWRRGS
jgi:pyruvate-ferredoxin/flavodoxin oxidoreductase